MAGRPWTTVRDDELPELLASLLKDGPPRSTPDSPLAQVGPIDSFEAQRRLIGGQLLDETPRSLAPSFA